MQYDDLYEYTGHMGRFQWIVFGAMFLVSLFTVDVVNMIFVGAEMDHWCHVDELSSLPPDQQKYIGIPHTSSRSDDVIAYSSCEVFDMNWTAYSAVELGNWNWTNWIKNGGSNSNSTVAVKRCASWNFDQSIFTSTIVSRFNLVCGSEYLVELATTLLMVGSLVGTMTSGAMSDRYGRKVSLVVYLIIKVGGSVVAIFAQDYITFVIGRFIADIGACGVGLTAFVIVMEMVGPLHRTVVGVVIQIAYSIGFMLTTVVAYFIRDDFYLQIATMAPSVVFIPYAILMSESPRWLIVRGRYEEAIAVLRTMCATNKTTLPDDLDLTSLEEETDVQDQGCSALVRSPSMRMRTVLVNFSWFTTSLVYFALSLFSTYDSVSDSLYVNTLISGAVEIPVCIAVIYLVDVKALGRRGTASYSLIGAGVTCFVCAFMIKYEFSIAVMLLSLLGKTLITLAYAVVYLHGSEIFPTEVRNVGLGVASTIEGIGAMVAPPIGGPMKRWWLPLPSIIYGSVSILCGFSYFYLPETLGEPLPDTVEQADKMAAAQKKASKRKRVQQGNFVELTKEDRNIPCDIVEERNGSCDILEGIRL